MRYYLTVRARPRKRDAVPARHERVMTALRALGLPWGPADDEWRQAKDPATQPLEVVNLRGVLGRGIQASLNYANRKHLPDRAGADDWLWAEFNPRKVDYAALVAEAMPSYVKALGAYLGVVMEEELVRRDFPRWQRSKASARSDVFRIQPLNFFDRELCRRAFNLTPAEVTKRLKGHVELARVQSGGVWIVVTSEVLGMTEVAKIDKRLRPLLEGAKRS